MCVVAIIPARGGSKGIYRKNLAELEGTPLVSYSIQAALRASTIDHVVVSTDDKEIAEVAVAMGCIVPGLRPHEISGDLATIDLAVDHAISGLEKIGINPTAVVIMYPTSPFRPDGLIDTLVKKLLNGHSPVHVVKPEVYSADGCFIDAEGKLQAIADSIEEKELSESLSFVSRTGLFYGYLRHHVAYAAPYVHVLDDPVAHVDIDGPEDLAFAREIVSTGVYRPEGGRA